MRVLQQSHGGTSCTAPLKVSELESLSRSTEGPQHPRFPPPLPQDVSTVVTGCCLPFRNPYSQVRPTGSLW